MKIGLDIDNTITRCPYFFSMLTHSIKKQGGTVHIVSSRTDVSEVLDKTREEMREFDVLYDHIYLLPEGETARGRCPHTDLDWYQKYIWQKVEYCINNGIDVYFDDEEKVSELFARYAPKIQFFKACGQ